MVSIRALILGLFLIPILFGCSESSRNAADTDTTEPGTNPETVVVGEKATLSATASTDDNNEQTRVDLSFHWEFISIPAGSKAVLVDADSPYPSFVADLQGTYTLKLSIFHQNELVSESEIAVIAQPQDPATEKPASHIASSDICNACHEPGSWTPARVNHEQVLGACDSCHQKPADHIPTTDSCETCHDTHSWAAEGALLKQNLMRWNRANIQTYQFTYQCSCLAGGNLVITVQDGVVATAHYAETDQPVSAEDMQKAITLRELFAIVDEALQRGAASTISYNLHYGYPEQFVVKTTDPVSHGVTDFQAIDEPSPHPEQALLDENKMRWQQANIAEYQFTYRRSCFCLPQEDIVAVVKAGVITEAYFEASGTPLSATEISNLLTVERLFATIQKAIDTNASTLSVAYNTVSGFPERVYIDQVENIADDEITHSIVNFQALREPPPADTAQRLLDENILLWQHAAIDEYQFVYRQDCLCPSQEDIWISVIANKVAQALFIPSNTALTQEQLAVLPGVETLFALIQDAIDSGAAKLSVSYNADHGYPEKVYIDRIADKTGEEITHFMLDFRLGPIDQPPSPPPTEEQLLLDENRTLWHQAGINDYRYTYRRSCFCAPQEDIVTVVKGGIIAEAFFTPSGTPLSADQIGNVVTIDRLFAIIQQAIDNKAAKLGVTYHADLGYPEKVYIDQVASIADEEITHMVLELQRSDPAPLLR